MGTAKDTVKHKRNQRNDDNPDDMGTAEHTVKHKEDNA